MPKDDRSNSLKDPELYEKLRDEGASQEKAARISNAAARDGRSEVGARGGRSDAYDEWTVEELRARARELDISGVSGLRKRELIQVLRDH